MMGQRQHDHHALQEADGKSQREKKRRIMIKATAAMPSFSSQTFQVKNRIWNTSSRDSDSFNYCRLVDTNRNEIYNIHAVCDVPAPLATNQSFTTVQLSSIRAEPQSFCSISYECSTLTVFCLSP